MHVGGAVSRRAREDVIDELHHGRVVGLRPQLFDVDGIFGRWRLGHEADAEVLSQDVVDVLADGGAIVPVDRGLDVHLRRDLEVDLEARDAPDVVDGDNVQWVGGGDDDAAGRALHRDDDVLARNVLWNDFHDVDVELSEPALSHQRPIELPRQDLEHRLLGEEAEVDEHLAQTLPRPPLPVDAGSDLLRRD